MEGTAVNRCPTLPHPADCRSTSRHDVTHASELVAGCHNPSEQPREFARDAYSPLLSFMSPWTGSCRDARTQWGYQSDHQHSQIWTTRMMPFCSPTVNPSGRTAGYTITLRHRCTNTWATHVMAENQDSKRRLWTSTITS